MGWQGAQPVAGFQDKLLVLMDGEKIFLADGALASTHILKPEPLNSAMPFLKVARSHLGQTLGIHLPGKKGVNLGTQVNTMA